MAAIAQRDQEQRKVEVNRIKLLETLEGNLKKHVQDYQDAMAGYKSTLLVKIDQAFEQAKDALQLKYGRLKTKVQALTDAAIEKQWDTIELVEAITIDMKVPRCFAKEYEAAIDMAKWDVRETLELTHAEFTCFVRDQWDWKSGFDAVSMLYKATLR